MIAELGHLSGLFGTSIAGYLVLPLKRDGSQISHSRRYGLVATVALLATIIVSMSLPDWTTGFGLWLAGLMVVPVLVVLTAPRLQPDTLRATALCATTIAVGVGLHGITG